MVTTFEIFQAIPGPFEIPSFIKKSHKTSKYLPLDHIWHFDTSSFQKFSLQLQPSNPIFNFNFPSSTGLPDLHPLHSWTLVRFQLPSLDLPRWAWRSHPTVLLLWLRPEAFAATTKATAFLRPQEPRWHRCSTAKQLKFVEGRRNGGEREVGQWGKGGTIAESELVISYLNIWEVSWRFYSPESHDGVLYQFRLTMVDHVFYTVVR